MATSASRSAGFESTLESFGIALEAEPVESTVERTYKPLGFPKSTSEPFETLRDLLETETRLRLSPPGGFKLESKSFRSKVWQGYGHTVVLRKRSRFGSWDVTVNGERVRADADRHEAFEAAGEEMATIANRQ
ncbi:hypothetical protein ACLI4U_18985 (plasmid) [Natrialbaceae archaeon A-CW2]